MRQRTFRIAHTNDTGEPIDEATVLIREPRGAPVSFLQVLTAVGMTATPGPRRRHPHLHRRRTDPPCQGPKPTGPGSATPSSRKETDPMQVHFAPPLAAEFTGTPETTELVVVRKLTSQRNTWEALDARDGGVVVSRTTPTAFLPEDDLQGLLTGWGMRWNEVHGDREADRVPAWVFVHLNNAGGLPLLRGRQAHPRGRLRPCAAGRLLQPRPELGLAHRLGGKPTPRRAGADRLRGRSRRALRMARRLRHRGAGADGMGLRLPPPTS